MQSDIVPVEALVERVRSHPHTPFYRDAWGNASVFSALPHVSRENLLATPLPLRRYKDESSLVKVVHDGERLFLSEWSFEDIAREPWGAGGERRPMVFLTDPYEAIEKSMWCYEHNILPLLPGLDPDIAGYAAGVYRIDSLITDERALPRLESYLSSRAEPLDVITVIGESFDEKALARFAPYTRRIRLVLSLPETGALGTGDFSAGATCRALPDMLVEKTSGGVAATKLHLLVTPIIRFLLPPQTAACLALP